MLNIHVYFSHILSYFVSFTDLLIWSFYLVSPTFCSFSCHLTHSFALIDCFDSIQCHLLLQDKYFWVIGIFSECLCLYLYLKLLFYVFSDKPCSSLFLHFYSIRVLGKRYESSLNFSHVSILLCYHKTL